MIGFDVPAELKDLRKNLLWKHQIFTGEAKPNVIRLLPSLALRKQEADEFLRSNPGRNSQYGFIDKSELT